MRRRRPGLPPAALKAPPSAVMKPPPVSTPKAPPLGTPPNPRRLRVVRGSGERALNDLFAIFPDLPRPARKPGRLPPRLSRRRR